MVGNGFFWFDSYFSGVCDALCAQSLEEAIWKTLVFGALWALVLVPAVTLVAAPVIHRAVRVLLPIVGPSGAIVLASLLAVVVIVAIGTLGLILSSDRAFSAENLTHAARIVWMLVVPGIMATVAVFVLGALWARIRTGLGGDR
ncbi:MAG: hypothetical protein AB7S99_09405 [Pseudodonghicola sp.]